MVLVALLFGLAPDAAAQDSSTDEARGAFDAGQAAYGAGRFPEALQYFQRAYELTQAPELLYNIATVQDRLRHDREALEAYRAYLAARPDTLDRANIESRISVLEQSIGNAAEPIEEPVEEEPPPEEPPPEPEPVVSSDPGPGPWIMAGGGGLLVAAGIVLVAVAQIDAQTVANGTSWGEIEDAYDRVPILSGTGFTFLGVGAALFASAMIWAATAGPSGETAEVAIGPGNVVVRGHF